MTSNIEFWTKRAKTFGHTGWNNQIIYYYDQKVRLLAIKKIIEELPLNFQNAFDFGCGSGDFSFLLSKYFKNVIGFDICEFLIFKNKKKYQQINAIKFYSGNIFDLDIPEKSVDLILSVTVLGVIMSEDELNRTLKYFNNILSNKGYVIALEYCPESIKKSSDYQKFWTFEEWKEFFSKNGFKLEKEIQFVHPVERPCESYLLYRKNLRGFRYISIKYFGKFLHNYLGNYHNLFLIDDYIKSYDFMWESDERKSNYKIMIYRKIIP
jgi:SAM-dependent methyltransferase